MKSNIEAPPKRYRYTGMERDEESGLNYHHARYYATWLGRWVSADPSFTDDGMNLWAYTHDEPTGARDLSGMDTQRDIARAKELIAKHPYAIHKPGWGNILKSPNPIRIENMATAGAKPYETIAATEDMGRAATMVTNISLAFAGGEIVGPLLAAAPRIVQYIMAVYQALSERSSQVRVPQKPSRATRSSMNR